VAEHTSRKPSRRPTKTKRNQLIAEAQKIEYDTGGYIVWAFNDQIDAYSAKLGGVVPDKSGVPFPASTSTSSSSPEWPAYIELT